MVEFFPTTRAVVGIGEFTIYWYGVLYIVAFAVAYVLIRRLQHYRRLAHKPSEILELVTWGAVGAVVGGRLGYVLLYEPAYYAAHWSEVWQVSQGGMSSHGGFVGVGITIWMWVLARFAPPPGGAVAPAVGSPPARHPLINIFDIIVVPAAVGLALGRLGNIINHELYLTPLAQLVAVGSPLIIAAVCYWALSRSTRVGFPAGLFLVLYSLSRFGEEWLREVEWPLGDSIFTWGQVYTLPLLVGGLYLLKDEVRRHHSRTN